MTIRLYAATTVDTATEVLAVPLFTDRKLPKGVSSPAGLNLKFLEARNFGGKNGEVQVLPNGTQSVVAFGLGDANDLTLEDLRRAGAAVIRANWNAEEITIVLGSVTANRYSAADAATALIEGAVLGAYSFDDYRSAPKPSGLKELTIVGPDTKAIEQGIDYAELTTSATYLARDLVNGMPDDVTPSYLAEIATEVARQNKLGLQIWDERKLKAEGMGGILGVAAGSDEPPRYIQLHYKPKGKKAKKTIALVGKGITFDSGGLSLKSGDGMMTMKIDMGGAAAVLATMSVINDLAPNVEVYGICCATENLPGPKAMMPGDVLTARNGKTIEVLNTDAEGRLVLADGLSRAVELGADAIIDLATLTGACVVALGSEIAGLMSTDDELRTQILDAAETTGEPFWHLPLPTRYRKHIDSDVADMKNIGAPGAAGTLSAGLFLKEFVGETPWAHLDIAGPVSERSDNGYLARGGTGFAVRTLMQFLRNF